METETGCSHRKRQHQQEARESFLKSKSGQIYSKLIQNGIQDPYPGLVHKALDQLSPSPHPALPSLIVSLPTLPSFIQIEPPSLHDPSLCSNLWAFASTSLSTCQRAAWPYLFQYSMSGLCHLLREAVFDQPRKHHLSSLSNSSPLFYLASLQIVHLVNRMTLDTALKNTTAC